MAAKDVLTVLHYLKDGALQFKKWVRRADSKTFKRRLVYVLR